MLFTGAEEAVQDTQVALRQVRTAALSGPAGWGGGSRRLEMAGGLGKKAHLGNVSDGERYSAGPACLPG